MSEIIESKYELLYDKTLLNMMKDCLNNPRFKSLILVKDIAEQKTIKEFIIKILDRAKIKRLCCAPDIFNLYFKNDSSIIIRIPRVTDRGYRINRLLCTPTVLGYTPQILQTIYIPMLCDYHKNTETFCS